MSCKIKRVLLTLLGVIMSMALITGTGIIAISLRQVFVQNEIDKKGNYHAAWINSDYKYADVISKHVEVKDMCVSVDGNYGLLADVSQRLKDALTDAPEHYLAHIYKYDQNAIKMLPVNLKA